MSETELRCESCGEAMQAGGHWVASGLRFRKRTWLTTIDETMATGCTWTCVAAYPEDHRYHDTAHQGCGSIPKGVALDTVVANSLGELEREMTLYGKE